MEVRSCRSCGKLYNYLGTSTPACPACMALIEEKFVKCKDYIRENPGANIQQVSDETEVSVKMIKQWVREERLTFAEGSSVGLECEGCGVNILTGRYCAACKSKMTQGFSQIVNQARKQEADAAAAAARKAASDSAKMRFLDNGQK